MIMSKEEQENGQFKLTLQVAKAFTKKSDDGVETKYVSGLASGVNLDLEGERMAKSAIEAFKSAIDNGVVKSDGTWGMIPLRSGHRREWDDVLGWVLKADVDAEHNLWIEAELDNNSSVAMDLYKRLTTPALPGRELKLGFSVAGTVVSASEEFDPLTKHRHRVFNEVKLSEISVVGQPAYPTAYVEAMTKSVDWNNPPFSLSKEMPRMDELAKTDGAKDNKTEASTTPNPAATEAAKLAAAAVPEEATNAAEPPTQATSAEATPTEQKKSVEEPDFDADIKRIAGEKAAEAVDPEIAKIVAEKQAATSDTEATPPGNKLQKDAASDALDEVDNAMDDAILTASAATYDKIITIANQAKKLLDADNGGEPAADDAVATLVEDAQDDALIATLRLLTDQLCDAASGLKQLFRADDLVDNIVDSGGSSAYNYAWSKKEETPEVVKDAEDKTSATKKDKTMDEKEIQKTVETAVTAAVSAALAGHSETVATLMKKIEELEATPIDKSLSVNAAKGGDENPRDAFRKSQEENIKNKAGNEIIRAAVAAALKVADAS